MEINIHKIKVTTMGLKKKWKLSSIVMHLNKLTNMCTSVEQWQRPQEQKGEEGVGLNIPIAKSTSGLSRD